MTTDQKQTQTPSPFGTTMIDPVGKSVDLRAWTRPRVEGDPAVPVEAAPADDTPGPRRPRGGGGPTHVGWALVFDTETTVDAAQQLNFGAYRLIYRTKVGNVTTAEEGVLYADNLPDRDPAGYATLVRYATTRRAEVTGGMVGPPGNQVPSQPDLQIMSRHDWVDRVLFRAMGIGAVTVGFNLPFDLSRIAVGAGPGVGDNYGAFSLKVWDVEGFRPNITIRNLDSKKSLISATGFNRTPPGWKNPRFLDLRTLTSAITDRGFSLKSACEQWGVKNGKTEVNEHGVITDDYIDYCRRDVEATTGLLGKVVRDFESYRVPDLGADRALSGASLAKATLKGFGLVPPLDRNPDFPVEILGAAMEAFYGGRSETRTRRAHVPAQVHDFTSMYPTVNTLTGLWGLLIADRITADESLDRVRDLLDRVTVDDCYRPEMWRGLVGVAQVIADGDVLPVRAVFKRGSSPVIGLQPVYSDRATWYTIADLVASKVLTGRVPTIVRAVTFTGHGVADGLTPSHLGSLRIDPAVDDPFTKVIEQRKRPGTDKTTGTFLKLFANSGSYGIFSEFVVKPHADNQPINVVTGDDQFASSQSTIEDPGAWCFPPIAATITGAARLMLALLERAVIDAGGWWAFCDTDSMAVITDDAGSLIACPGGQYRDPAGRECVRALTPTQTEVIRKRFDTMLNPYDQTIIPHLLKYEYSATVYAVSAKRYATYQLDKNGQVDHVTGTDGKIVDLGKQHGVGYLTSPDEDRDNPDTPMDTSDRTWIDTLWRTVIERDLGIDADDGRVRAWHNLATITRLSITSPYMLNQVRTLNEGKCWADQIKPFNFLSMLIGDRFGDQGALVGPYTRDNRNARDREWLDLRTGETTRVRYGISVAGWDDDSTDLGVDDDSIEVVDYGKVVLRHDRSVESKYRAPGGGLCTDDTRGVLLRVPVRARWHRYIGKEVSSLDESEHLAFGQGVGVLGGDDEWTQSLPTLRELGVRAIRAELDRDGGGHDRIDNADVDTRELLRGQITDAPNESTRKRRTEKLTQWQMDRERRHKELDETEPRITDSQLYRILKQTTTRPRKNVRSRLIRLAREHTERVESGIRGVTS